MTRFRLLAVPLLALSALLPAVAHATEQAESPGLYFELTPNATGDGYQVNAIPTQTPDGDISLTGQVTIKVPHSSEAADRFMPMGITSLIDGVEWIEHSRVDAPAEVDDADYISFSFTPGKGTPMAFLAGEQDKAQPLFSFKNNGPCLGDVALMANDDAFNQLPNSANTNPGNHFNNLGWGAIGGNHYLGNAGDAVACPGSQGR